MTQLAQEISSGTYQQPSNYQFIEHSFPKLYRVAQEAEQYYATDHACCLLKSRLFIELWCHEVADKLDKCPKLHGDLIDKIEQLAASQQIPPYLIEILHSIRCQGNKAVHITKCFDGQWVGDATLSKTKLKRLMTDLFELTQYLACKLNNQNENALIWQEPTHNEFADLVYASLSGNKEASFALAQQASMQMKAAHLQKDTSNVEKKESWKLLQRDLSYWLERAHRQGHQETWLMYANAYLSKQLILPQGQSIDACFKLAIENDVDGDATFQYGCYLSTHAQPARAEQLLIAAGELSNHQALAILLQKYYVEDKQQYAYWLKLSLAAQEKSAYTLDLFEKMQQWENDQANDVLKKKVKTALVNAHSRQAPGALFYRGYCDYHGYWGKTPDTKSGLKDMLAHYKQLPSFLDYQPSLFNVLNNEPTCVSQAIEVGADALRNTSLGESSPKIKFELAMLIWSRLQNNKSVRCPHSLKSLLRESAKEGYFEAMQFIKSPKGKALLRDNSVICIKTQHNKVNRSKQKQAKKAARKAKRR